MIVTRFRSTCFDFSSDRLLPEILTFPMVTEVRIAANETGLSVQILTHGVLGAFQLQLGQGLLDAVHLNSNFPKQTFQSHELHTKMMSDMVLYDGNLLMAQNHQQNFDIEVLCHIYLMIVDAIFKGLFARPPVLRGV